MTTSVTRSCFTTQHQTCKTKAKTKTDFFGLRPILSQDRRSQTTSLVITRQYLSRVFTAKFDDGNFFISVRKPGRLSDSVTHADPFCSPEILTILDPNSYFCVLSHQTHYSYLITIAATVIASSTSSDFFTPPPWGVFTPHTMMDTPQTQTVTGTPLGGVVPPYNLFSHSFVMNTLIEYGLHSIRCVI